MNRTDLKFVIHREKLPEILQAIREYYNVLEINEKRIMKYDTCYFDTTDNEMYTKHHNGKLNRYKVRERTYVDTNETFLEIKFKNNKRRTLKKRISANKEAEAYPESCKKFVRGNTPFRFDYLEPRLNNRFSRLTLVHKTAQERVTIDLNLEFEHEGEVHQLPQIAIIEVKRDKSSSKTELLQTLNKLRITSVGMSKYCTGLAILNPSVKRNRFKEKLLWLQKLQSA